MFTSNACHKLPFELFYPSIFYNLNIDHFDQEQGKFYSL